MAVGDFAPLFLPRQSIPPLRPSSSSSSSLVVSTSSIPRDKLLIHSKMRSSRIQLLLGALFVLILLFSTVTAHGHHDMGDIANQGRNPNAKPRPNQHRPPQDHPGHEGHDHEGHEHHDEHDILEDEEATPPVAESTSSVAVDLPTFTVPLPVRH